MLSIHDHRILSIEFLPKEHKLILKTERSIPKGFEEVHLIFFDVFAYGFTDMEEENILDEVTQSSPSAFLNWYYANNTYTQIRFVMEYNLPLPFDTIESAIHEVVNKEMYVYFEVNACVGLDGWIFAKRLEIEQVSPH